MSDVKKLCCGMCYTFALCLYAFTTNTAATSSASILRLVSKNYRNNGNILNEYTVPSLVICGLYCYRQKTCRSLSYNKADGSCILHDTCPEKFSMENIPSPEWSIYRRLDHEMRHKGCFKNFPYNGYQFTDDVELTIAKCISDCRNLNYAYAGAQEYDCFCENENRGTKTPDSECNYRCYADDCEVCGGFLKVSVFTTM